MHLLRSSVFGAGVGKKKNKVLRHVGSSPKAAAPRLMMSKTDSMKKRSDRSGTSTKKGGGVKQGSKRARLRAGLAAALQELKLAGRRNHGRVSVSSATTRPAGQVGTLCCADTAAAAARPEEPAMSSRGVESGGALLPVLMLVLALVCVVALGRAPAVCCCTCAAWWCRRRSSTDGSRVLCSDDAVRLRPSAARQRCW